MTWRSMEEPPEHTGPVELCNGWGDRFSAYCDKRTDGRRWYGCGWYIDDEKLHRYMWKEHEPAPTEEEWKVYLATWRDQ